MLERLGRVTILLKNERWALDETAEARAEMPESIVALRHALHYDLLDSGSSAGHA